MDSIGQSASDRSLYNNVHYVIVTRREVMIDEPRFKNIQKERDLLSVAHIKKLEEEIDMLRKQKIYLQSKLREKTEKR
jgi:hypothetical protein